MKLKTCEDLPASIRHLLETGRSWPDKGKWTDFGEPWLRPFQLASPAGRPELLGIWAAHRERILSEWKAAGHKRKPWAQRVLDDGGPDE